ncbi:MAG: thioesterase family protein [Streptosporangiaceae bacterium]
MTTFDDATAVIKRAEGRYEAQADPRFAMVVAASSTAPPAINGGVLMATVLRAVLDAAPNPHPVATSANFLRVPRLGAAEVQVSWLKMGRTASTARATLVQDDAPVVDMTVTTGTVPGGSVTARIGQADEADGSSGESLDWTGEPPAFPAMADCIDLGRWAGTEGVNGVAGFAAHVEVLLDPAVTGWRGGEPSGIPEMRGYFTLREPRDPDALLLALAVDVLPPVVFGLGATGWAPTVELTWHMRAVPQPGPLRVATRCRHVSGGWFDEEAEVWDAAGRLVAQSRQLARVGRGRLRPRASADRLAAAAEGS